MRSKTFLLILLLLAIMTSCSVRGKIRRISDNDIRPSLSLPERREYLPVVADVPVVHRDTLTIKDMDGKEYLVMRAVRDEESGEMVATEQLEAAVVTARFRNVAERHGKVDLEFQVIVPSSMKDGKWQLRFKPYMYVMQDTVKLDDVIITGSEYRKAQLRGYQQYDRFIRSIVLDSLEFVDFRNLNIWIDRNLPALAAFRNDSSFVSDEEFESGFGTSGLDALEHYTNQLAKRRNARRYANRDRMWHKYVKTPILTEGIRLDTVIADVNGDFIYNYIQTINTRKGLRKVDISLSGEIFEQERRIYAIPMSEPLSFYISSVSAFVDNTERYMTKVISRTVSANATAHIEFRAGGYEIDEDLSDNGSEIRQIKTNLRRLMLSDEFVMDSIAIVPFASPEGIEKNNDRLCLNRARSASAFFRKFIKEVEDSIAREAGMFISVDENLQESGMKGLSGREQIKFKSLAGGENWNLLDELVERDTILSLTQKDEYRWLRETVADNDEREKKLAGCSSYRRIRQELYPALRSVRFDFALHRKGMVKDTVHTTEPDTLYARGVQCIRDRDYDTAIELLRPYQDFNTAVAYVAMDYNMSAFAILKECARTAQVDYMLALLYSRMGDDQNAVQYYVDSCGKDPSFVSRGNLDPEISSLINKYNLNLSPDDDWDNY